MESTATEHLELRLQRAETLLRVASEISFDQPLDEVFRVLATTIAHDTRAVAAGLVLLNRSDLSPIAIGDHNLPDGYLRAVTAGFQSPERAEAIRRSVAGEQTNVVRNAPAMMLAQPEYRSMQDILRDVPFDTVVTTPFLRREETVGFVGIYYAPGEDIDDDEVAFARAIAAQAAPIMDNAWLFKEAERRSAELEALARADQALHQSLHLEDVFQSLIGLAVDLFGADRSMFLSWDETDRLHAFVARGVPEDELARLQEVYHRIARADQAVTSPDIRVMEDVQGNDRVHPGVRTVTTSASAVDIPVQVNGEVFGVFVLGYHTRRVFSEGDRRMFRTLASRAGLAIQNAVLFQESQRRTQELEALYRADEALHRSLALEDVLKAMTDLAIDLLGADSSLVATFGDDDRLGVVISRGLDHELFEIINDGYRRFSRAQVAQAQDPPRTGLTEDIHTDPRADDRLRNRSVGSVAEIPVVVAGEIWGFFSIGWGRPRHFPEAERRMFDAFSARASLAIQNAILFDQAQQSASLEERQRIARELHDSVSQALYGIGLGARTLRRRLGTNADTQLSEPVEYIAGLAEGGLAETRALIFELIPNSLETDGLTTALQRQAAATQARHQVAIEVVVSEEPDIPIRAKEALYRIAQESLGNVAKHAQATSARVTLETAPGAVVLRIADNGRGFDPTGDFPGHFGLRSMAERAARVGAAYLIESTPGEGATITVTLPVS
jgi:signal transduction histidine kinase